MLFICLAYSKSYLPNFLLGRYICDIPIHHKENKQAELIRGRVDSGAELVPGRVDPLPFVELLLLGGLESEWSIVGCPT